MGDYFTRTQYIMENNTQKHRKEYFASCNSKTEYEMLGSILFLNKDYSWFISDNIGIKQVDNNPNYLVDKANIIYFIAERNYQTVVATLEDFLLTPQNFKKISTDKIISFCSSNTSYNILRNHYELPNTYVGVKNTLLNLLTKSANSLFANIKHLPITPEKDKQKDAISLLKKIISLRENIINNNFNFDKFFELKIAKINLEINNS